MEAEIFEIDLYFKKLQQHELSPNYRIHTTYTHTSTDINDCTAFILIYSNTVGAVILSSVADVTTDFSSYNYTAIYQLLL